ncbi:hypothetical protein G7046_g4028 [Stylonectria norvegica]|nr:hypothetical protein G7046_g4028 [Stylonectria norvegica]
MGGKVSTPAKPVPELSELSELSYRLQHRARWLHLSDHYKHLRSITDNSIVSLATKIRTQVLGESTISGEVLYRLGGNFNMNHVVQLDDMKMVLRVPVVGSKNTMTREDVILMESHVATLKFVGSMTTIPVPRVYSYDTTTNNEMGVPYICMSHASGTPLRDTWYEPEDKTDDTRVPREARRRRTLKELASYMAQLSRFKFPQNGSLLLREDGDYYIGPEIVPIYDMDRLPWPQELHTRGPYDQDEFDANFLSLAPPIEETPDKDHADLAVRTFIIACLSASLPLPADYREGFVLNRTTIDQKDIFVDDDGKITGIINWEKKSTLQPPWLGPCISPCWLMRDWDPTRDYEWPPLPEREGIESPEQLEKYRQFYYDELIKAMDGSPDIKWVRKSHLRSAIFLGNAMPGQRRKYCKKFLQEAMKIDYGDSATAVGDICHRLRQPDGALYLASKLNELISPDQGAQPDILASSGKDTRKMAPSNSSPELRPLLRVASQDSSISNPSSALHTPNDVKPTYSRSLSERDIASGETRPSRRIEDDVLPETSTLGRTLTWSSAYILVISRVIGSGIFATPGAIVQSVGSAGLALSLWLVGAAIAACGLAVSLEYGCMLPRSGGHKVYLEFTYRWPRFLASTLIAIQVVLLGFTASNCIIFSQYALFAFGIDDASDLHLKGIAVALLSAITIIHGVFPRTGLKLQNFLGWVKVGVIIFMILSGAYVVVFHPTSESINRAKGQLSWDQLWKDSNWNWGVISTGLFKVFYSYAGLENATNVLNEVKDPVRTLRSVSLAALVTVCSMYFFINVAYFLVIPIDEIKESGELIAALFFERLFGETVGRVILPLAVGLSAAGNVMVVAFAMARIKQEIARQGFLPFSEILSSTKPFNSPLGGFIVNYIPSLLVIILPPSGDVYSFILEVEGYSAQIFSLAVGFGLIYLRSKRPDLQRPFKAWIPAVWVKIALGFALLAAPFFPPPEGSQKGMFYATYAIVSVAIVIAGVLYWWLWTVVVPRWRGLRLEEETEVLADGTSITRFIHRRLEH